MAYANTSGDILNAVKYIDSCPYAEISLDTPLHDRTCHICTTQFEFSEDSSAPSERPIRLSCNHVLGATCAKRWLSPLHSNNNHCPFCRAEFYRRPCNGDTSIGLLARIIAFDAGYRLVGFERSVEEEHARFILMKHCLEGPLYDEQHPSERKQWKALVSGMKRFIHHGYARSEKFRSYEMSETPRPKPENSFTSPSSTETLSEAAEQTATKVEGKKIQYREIVWEALAVCLLTTPLTEGSMVGLTRAFLEAEEFSPIMEETSTKALNIPTSKRSLNPQLLRWSTRQLVQARVAQVDGSCQNRMSYAKALQRDDSIPTVQKGPERDMREHPAYDTFNATSLLHQPPPRQQQQQQVPQQTHRQPTRPS
ncbi:MAG: hypothetical protein Q9166_004338 [cf. Caloplaca sp. 2 TL-2023]